MNQLDILKTNWYKFKQDLSKILMDPTKYENNSRKYLEDKLKPRL